MFVPYKNVLSESLFTDSSKVVPFRKLKIQRTINADKESFSDKNDNNEDN